MRSLYRRAASPLLTLAAAALAVPALSPANAQDSSDPFALPTSATLDNARKVDAGPLMSEIVVDGRTRPRMVKLEGRGDSLAIDAADARAAGLPVADGAHGLIPVTALKIYQWKFDSFRQRLTIALLRDNDGPNLRDLSAQRYGPSESTPLTAFRFDYDTTAQVTSRGATFGGLFNAAIVRGNVSFASAARVLGDSAAGQLEVKRLDTQVQILWDRKGLVANAGDFVSAGSQSQRPVRMAGLQLATDADLRPDLVSMPLPGFTGSVAVPTTIDIVNADSRRQVGQLEPGAFTVRNIPAPMGRGELSAVLRDALGRETTQTVRFYLSSDLLGKGRSAYAVNFGFVRRRYGERNADYGPAAASAYLRRGLSDVLTVEASGEWTPGLVNAGLRADFTIAKLAKATIEGRLSRDVMTGTGHLLNLGLESMGTRFGSLVGATLPGATYRDVASRLGDAAPPRRIFANVFWRPLLDYRLQVGVVRSDERADQRLGLPARRIDSAIGSLDVRLSSRARLIVAGEYRNFAGQRSTTVSAGLSFYLGKRNHFSAQGRYGTEERSAELYYARERDKPTDLGYSVSAREDNGSRIFTGRAQWRAPMMELTGEAELNDGRPAARFSSRGSILFAGGRFYARNTSSTGFALVQAGKVEGVPITLENRFVGKTNAKGRLFVDDISPLVPVKINVDPKQLPHDALVRETEHVIRVPQRAVALVRLDAIRFRPVVRAIVDRSGTPIGAGLRVTALPSREHSISGFEGLVEINSGAADERLVIGGGTGSCVVELRGIDLARDGAPPLVCTPVTIAEDSLESPVKLAKGAPRGKRRHGAQVARNDAERSRE